MEQSVIQQPTPLIVEFVGLPGAGKTTISQQVVSQLRDRGLQIVFRSEILEQWQRKNFLQKAIQLFPKNLNHWHILINSLVLAWQVKPINWHSFAKAVKIFTNVKRNDAVAHVNHCDIILLDQGLLQETWSVGITGNSPQTKYLQQGITPIFRNRATLIIYCRVNVSTALKRIQNRQTMNSRFDRMDSKQAYSTMEKYASYLEEIISCARACHVPILALDSSQTIKSQSQKIIDLLSNLSSG
ncbi:MAG: hypothetical protein ACRC06_10680 [Waterburya sp.]